jgi:hypothetical protein
VIGQGFEAAAARELDDPGRHGVVVSRELVAVAHEKGEYREESRPLVPVVKGCPSATP